MIKKLVDYIQSYDGIDDKSKLSSLVAERFCCRKNRSVFYCEHFAIRFSSAKSVSFANTVLSLSTLEKYDDIPFFVCIVSPNQNRMLIANTTFLSKISHSSQSLRIDNIRGSFNGSDIITKYGSIYNISKNFEELFSIHQRYTFEENLVRLVESTNNIAPIGKPFQPNHHQITKIMTAPTRAKDFVNSNLFEILKQELEERVAKFQNEILISAQIDDVKTRGNTIEYLVAGEDSEMRRDIANALRTKSIIPHPLVRDGSCFFAIYI